MRTYIEIYGPPLLRAIKELERIAVDMPQVCIMDTILAGAPTFTYDATHDYFAIIPGSKITKERCGKIVSGSREMLGDYDFFFEWFRDPSQTDMEELIGKIDETLAPLGCKYRLITKKE